jgi:hypothetical protein
LRDRSGTAEGGSGRETPDGDRVSPASGEERVPENAGGAPGRKEAVS